jgi:ABC-type multidrug transport system fused ATPase/permease subunit
VISIIGFLTPPLRDLGRAQEYWLAAQVARDNLRKIARQAPRLREPRGAQPIQIGAGRISFDTVTVSGALNHVCAEAAARARIVVFGPNGSGKSTLLGLVGRLFDPDAGRVLIDGQDIAKVRTTSLRQQIAYVSADMPLIRGSLRKNLCYGAAQVDDERLRQVLADCRLDDLIDRLPGGLDGRIAESGADLSQGERVRVGLARALLRQPRIMLLDEAEANLDRQAICALDAIVARFEGTVLMATHRQAAQQTCDALWRLRDGHVESIANPRSPADRRGEVVFFGGPAAASRPTSPALGIRGTE